MYKENFITNIKKARKEKNYTQEYVADVLNITRSNITKYENGNLEPSIEMIGKLAELYNISVDWLLGIKKTS